MDWTLALIVIAFAAFLGGRVCIGIWFEDSWLNSVLDGPDIADTTDEGDCGGGDGGD